jgi:hypothetical protein
MSLNTCWQFGNILLLSSNNRVSSFYWIGASKHCFLTSFSNLNCYFLFLVFSCSRYLLVSLGLSWLHGNPISCPIYAYLWYFDIVRAPQHFWHTWRVISKQDACGNLILELVTVFFPHSAFRQRFLIKHPLDDHKYYLFFLHNILKLTLSCMT